MPSLPLFRVRASFSFEDCLSANISASRVCTYEKRVEGLRFRISGVEFRVSGGFKDCLSTNISALHVCEPVKRGFWDGGFMV